MKLIYDQAAHAILQDPEFVEQWKKLHSRCHYATAFQEPAFVCSWYEAYRNQWNPLILYSQNSLGEFVGLLLLAYDPSTRSLVHAGSSQSEYHSWLSLPDEDTSFLSAAWVQLTRQFKFTTLRFRYLPVAEPLTDILRRLPNKHSIGLRKRPRPLMILNADEIKASFAKKSNKSRFNRLKKLGEIRFQRITDPIELNQVFDELITFYDLRQGAVNQSRPFQHDPNKREFHINMFGRNQGNVNLTVTYLNDRPIAGLWGLVSKNRLHLCLIMHSPILAEHSIGKLHIMKLSESLLSDHIDTLDLTPGSDPWKERFANSHDEVAEAIIYRSVAAKIRGEAIYGLLNWLRNRANRFGVTTAKLKEMSAIVRELRFSVIIGGIAKWVKKGSEFHVYQIERSFADKCHHDERVHCNKLDDLLLFNSKTVKPSEFGFLSKALALLERGEKAYTMISNNRLVYCAWMNTDQSNDMQITSVPMSITIHDFFIDSKYEKQEFFQAALRHMLYEAFSDSNIQSAVISIPSENRQCCRLAEEIGFTYLKSFVSSNL